MGQRGVVTKAMATRYQRADKVAKGVILDELCAVTGWHRSHARKALTAALMPRVVHARQPRTPRYGQEVVAALAFCWAVLGAPTGKRLAPIMGDLVPRLRRFGELDISDQTAALLVAMSPATMDRRLAGVRAKVLLRGRSRAKPGLLLKSRIPIRTWAVWDDAVPGFVEIDLVGHEGGNALGDHCCTLTVTDIATGWTENRSVRARAGRWVIAALEEIALVMPFPIIGIHCDSGSEIINDYLLDWCTQHQVTLTRSRPGNSSDGTHPEQGTWAVVRTMVGDHRYDTSAELLLLNKIWVLQSLMTNYFYPQQKLISKVRNGTKTTKKYDRATTPHHRAAGHPSVTAEDKIILADTYAELNPAAIQREIHELRARLLNITANKPHPAAIPSPPATRTHPPARNSAKQATRAS
jgi:hypothetical protein